jgi:Zn-dependent M32 family carboxypeptidase
MNIGKMVTAIIDDLSNARETAEAYNEYVRIFQGYRGEPASVLEYTTHPLWIGVKGLVRISTQIGKRLFTSHLVGICLVIVIGYILGRIMK